VPERCRQAGKQGVRHSYSMRYLGWGAVAAVTVALISPTLGVDGAGASAQAYPPIIRGDVIPACPGPSVVPPISQAELPALRSAVGAFTSAHGYSETPGLCGDGLLILGLPIGDENLAQKVWAKFGPSVQIEIGDTLWEGHPGKSPLCGTLAKPAATSAPWTATLTLRSTRIKTGHIFFGAVAFHNTGTTTLSYRGIGSAEAVIIKPGTRRVVGIFTGAFAASAGIFTLGPGQTESMPLIGGTGRCDGGSGPTVPPGHYDAVAQVSGTGLTGVDTTGPIHFTQIVPVRIVN
jgi:hypothetical protein